MFNGKFIGKSYLMDHPCFPAKVLDTISNLQSLGITAAITHGTGPYFLMVMIV